MGFDPQDIFVVGSIAVGILKGCLRFSHATQATDDLKMRLYCLLAIGKGLMQLYEGVITPCKEAIPGEWYVRDKHWVCLLMLFVCYVWDWYDLVRLSLWRVCIGIQIADSLFDALHDIFKGVVGGRPTAYWLTTRRKHLQACEGSIFMIYWAQQ